MLVNIYARSMLNATRHSDVPLAPLAPSPSPAQDTNAKRNSFRDLASYSASVLALWLSPQTARRVLAKAPQVALSPLAQDATVTSPCK